MMKADTRHAIDTAWAMIRDAQWELESVLTKADEAARPGIEAAIATCKKLRGDLPQLPGFAPGGGDFAPPGKPAAQA